VREMLIVLSRSFHMTYSSSKLYPRNFLHPPDSRSCCLSPGAKICCIILRCKIQAIDLKFVPSGVTIVMFDCFNINHYARFKSERGLRMHLWRSSSCKDYMERQRSGSWASVGGCPKIVSTMHCPCYGV
jgi:hypothetical protein